MEVWKDIKGHEGKYQVSSEGNLRWIFQYKDGTSTIKKKRPVEASSCYRVDIKDKCYSLAQLVLIAFGIPKPPETDTYFYVASYKDGNWENCCLENLYWKKRTRHKKKGKVA